jgi:signal transduction histidine kinase
MELRPTAHREAVTRPIRQLGEAAATRLYIPVVCHITAEAEPPTGVKLSLYRIAQEALHNMAKHSRASHVEIRYLALPRGVQLAIVDDGRGFDFDRRSPGQMGLGTMREREQIGAN